MRRVDRSALYKTPWQKKNSFPNHQTPITPARKAGLLKSPEKSSVSPKLKSTNAKRLGEIGGLATKLRKRGHPLHEMFDGAVNTFGFLLIVPIAAVRDTIAPCILEGPEVERYVSQ